MDLLIQYIDILREEIKAEILRLKLCNYLICICLIGLTRNKLIGKRRNALPKLTLEDE